ncbi:MAG: roadblock/LC7 domain-containing protein [Blastocatellia bacterium]
MTGNGFGGDRENWHNVGVRRTKTTKQQTENTPEIRTPRELPPVFTRVLQQLTQGYAGAEAAAMIGLDGVVVESAGTCRHGNMETLAAEAASLMYNALKTSGDTGLGDVRELIFQADNATICTAVLGAEYFLMLVLAADCNFGRARYEIRKSQLTLEEEFVA